MSTNIISHGPGFTGESIDYEEPQVILDSPIDTGRRMNLDPNVLARNQAETAAVGLPGAQSDEERLTLHSLMALAIQGQALYAATKRPEGSVGGTSEAVRPMNDAVRQRRRGNGPKRNKGKKSAGMDVPKPEENAKAGQSQAEGAMFPLLMGVAIGLLIWLLTKNVTYAAIAGIGAVVLFSLTV